MSLAQTLKNLTQVKFHLLWASWGLTKYILLIRKIDSNIEPFQTRRGFSRDGPSLQSGILQRRSLALSSHMCVVFPTKSPWKFGGKPAIDFIIGNFLYPLTVRGAELNVGMGFNFRRMPVII